MNLEKTRYLYFNREDKCGAMENIGSERLLDFYGQTKTVNDLKNFLTERNIGLKSSDKKRDLLKKAVDNYQNMIFAGRRTGDYYKQRRILEDAMEKKVPQKFIELSNKIEKAEKEGKKGLFDPVVDFNSMDMDSIIKFNKESEADEVFEAIKKHIGEVCLVYGGGGPGSEEVYIDHVTKTKSQGSEKSFPGLGITVQVRLFVPSDLQVAHDSCDIVNDRTDWIHHERGLDDIKEFTPFIGSWKIACLNN